MSQHDQQLADLQSQLDYTNLRLRVAVESAAQAHATLAGLRLAATGTPFGAGGIVDEDMDAAGEPDPDAHLPVMPANALRSQHARIGMPAGPWGGPWSWRS